MNLYLLILVAPAQYRECRVGPITTRRDCHRRSPQPSVAGSRVPHEPLLAPGPSEHPIVLDEQNRFALLLNISKGTLVTGYYRGERYFLIPFFVEPGDSLHAVVTFAEVSAADSAAAVESDSLDSAEEEEAPPAYSLTFNGRGADNNRFLAEFWPQHHAFYPDNGLEAEG